VLVKCEFNRHKGMPNVELLDDIHLNQQDHITLFPVKQSLEKAVKIYSAPFNEDYQSIEDAFKAGAEWAKKNNY